MDNEDPIEIEKARYLPSRKSYQIKTTSATMLTTLLKNSLPPKYGLWCPQVQNKSDLCLIVNLKQPMLKQYLKGRLTRLLQTAFSDPELNPITPHLKLCIPPRISPDRVTLVFTATPTLIEAIKHHQNIFKQVKPAEQLTICF